MTNKIKEHDYQEAYDRLVNQKLFQDQSDTTSKVRSTGLKDFLSVGFPAKRKGNEEWKYTDIRPIMNDSFESPYEAKKVVNSKEDSLIKDAIESVLVDKENPTTSLIFVDGIYKPDLSNIPAEQSSVEISNLVDARNKSYSSVIDEYISTRSTTDVSGFTAMNTAFLDQGAFIHILPKQKSDQLIQVIFLSTDLVNQSFSIPRVLIVAGNDSVSNVIESYASIGNTKHFSNSVTEIIVGQGSILNYTKTQDYNESTYHVSTTDVEVQANARFSSMNLDIGSRLARNNLNIKMVGEGGLARINGAYVVSRSQHIDNQEIIDHDVGNNDSNEIYKGILDGHSRSVFHGSIIVREKAAGVNANQVDKNLLLSNTAEADTKPAFWVYCDDVRCGHGAACGQIDEDAIFYLMSRGVTEEQAKRILIRAFVAEVIDTVENDTLKEYLQYVVENKLDHL